MLKELIVSEAAVCSITTLDNKVSILVSVDYIQMQKKRTWREHGINVYKACKNLTNVQILH